MLLDDASFSKVRAVFLDPDSWDLITFLASLNLGTLNDLENTKEVATQLELFNPDTQSLTSRGWLVSDSCREYIFWIERDRQLPFLGYTDLLTIDAFENKEILEVGSGMGANLMSLSPFALNIEGLEPVGIYRQMGSILREREGLPEVKTLYGWAENLPYKDSSFDVVLCVSSHQYTDIRLAFSEMARVLRPNGELILIGGVFGKFLGELCATIPSSVRSFRSGLVTLSNTISYIAVGKRMVRSRGLGTTSRPIYLPSRVLCRIMAEKGLRVSVPGAVLNDEWLFRATKEKV